MGFALYAPTANARRFLDHVASIADGDEHADDQRIVNTVLRGLLEPAFGPEAGYDSPDWAFARSGSSDMPLTCVSLDRPR